MAFGLNTGMARRIFPFTPSENLKRNLPDVIVTAEVVQADRITLLLALATIRAETEPFLPCCEEVSRFNTSVNGRPFDLYDFRKDLGNNGPNDGEKFRGRGYIQLTGRANYKRLGDSLQLDLVGDPDLAAVSIPAARILFQFLEQNKEKLHRYVASGDLDSARRLVNGGFHGLARFRDAFRIADSLLMNS